MHNDGQHTMTVTTIEWQAMREAGTRRESESRAMAQPLLVKFQRGLLTVSDLALALCEIENREVR